MLACAQCHHTSTARQKDRAGAPTSIVFWRFGSFAPLLCWHAHSAVTPALPDRKMGQVLYSQPTAAVPSLVADLCSVLPGLCVFSVPNGS
jgi:hypothetical protein